MSRGGVPPGKGSLSHYLPGGLPVVHPSDGGELLDLDRLSRRLVEDLATGPLEGRRCPVGATEGVGLGLRVLEEVAVLVGSRVHRDSGGTLLAVAVLDCGQEQLERGLEDHARRSSGVHGVDGLAEERVLPGLVGLGLARLGELLGLCGLPGQEGLLLLETSLREGPGPATDGVRLVVHDSCSLPLTRTTWVKRRCTMGEMIATSKTL